MTAPLFRVVAINIETGARRILAEKKTRENAEAIVKLAVMRRGVDEEYVTAEEDPA